MPTTSNFGWTTPADTDLVKDGASAIRTLGNGIDTSFLDLKGGTTDQVLAKNSNTDLDFKWVAQDDSNAIQNAIVDAKGDLISATAADTPARIGVGTNGQVLTADSTTSTGLKWATPSGYTALPAFRAQPTSGQVISANTWTKVTLGTEIFDTNNKFANSTFTPTVAGYYVLNMHYVMEGGNQVFQTAIYKNGTIYDDLYWGTSGYPGRAQTTIMYLDSDDYVEMYVKTDLGNQVLNTASYFAGLGVRE
jgi:hypothetical protein